MEKSFRIIYTLLLCLLAVSANAQKNKKDKDEVKISAAKYGHENEMYNVGVSLKEVECL